MHSTVGIAVDATPERVFDLARDVSRWPEMLPHYRRVTVRSSSGGHVVAQMVAVRRFGPVPVPVTWRAEQWSDASDPADLRLHFRHIRGVTRGKDGTWHIRSAGVGHEGSSDVTIEHEFSRRLPLLGDRLLPAVVDRFFTRPIAGRTLATFKALAESAERSAANQPS